MPESECSGSLRTGRHVRLLRFRTSLRARLGLGDRGAGSILAIAVLASVVLLTGMLIPVSLALAAKQRVESASDAAALAAADTASGRVGGYSCEAAKRAAELNGAVLDSCSLDGIVATVSAHTDYLGFTISARSRAGPPGAG